MKTLGSVIILVLLGLSAACTRENQSFKSQDYTTLTIELRHSILSAVGEIPLDVIAVVFIPGRKGEECANEISAFEDSNSDNKKVIWLYRDVAGNIAVSSFGDNGMILTIDRRVIWDSALLTEFPVIYHLKNGDVIGKTKLQRSNVKQALTKLIKDSSS